MVARRSRRSSSQRARAASASSSTAWRRPRRRETPRGLVLVAGEGGLDTGDLDLAGRRRGRGVALTDVADAGEQVGLGIRELLLRDLAELQAHLGGQELLAQEGVVVELGVDGLDEL